MTSPGDGSFFFRMLFNLNYSVVLSVRFLGSLCSVIDVFTSQTSKCLDQKVLFLLLSFFSDLKKGNTVQ